MARIFYWQTDGNIYGVHPGPHDPAAVPIPAGVAWLDVAEAPHLISWPAGSQQYSRVNPTTLALETRTDISRPARCLDFVGKIHLNLNGLTVSVQFNRGLSLRNKSLATVATFVNDLRLAGNAASAGAREAIRSSWSVLKADPIIGVTGSDPEHLTTAEAGRIETDAVTNFGFSLV